MLHQAESFFDQALLEHLLCPRIEALVEEFALRIQAQAKNAKALKRIAALLPKVGHAPAGADADLQGAVNGYGITTHDFAVKVFGKSDGQRGFSAARRAQEYYQQRQAQAALHQWRSHVKS